MAPTEKRNEMKRAIAYLEMVLIEIEQDLEAITDQCKRNNLDVRFDLEWQQLNRELAKVRRALKELK